MQLPYTLMPLASRRLAILLLVAHGGALAVLSALSLSAWISQLLLAIILWSAWRSVQSNRGLSRITSLTLRADGKLQYSRANGQSGEALIHPHTTVTPRLTIVLLRLQGREPPNQAWARVEPLVLLPDSLKAEEFRQLRLWLRWQAEVSPRTL